MRKRRLIKTVVALIGVLAVLTAAALPCFAAELEATEGAALAATYDASFTFEPAKYYASTLPFLNRNPFLIVSEALFYDGVNYTSVVEFAVYLYLAEEGFYFVVRGTFDGVQSVIDTRSMTSSLTVYYNRSDIIRCENLNCSLAGIPYAYTAAEMDAAYNDGFADGEASIDTDAYYQNGYNAGFTEGEASVDTDSFYQNGYNTGFTDGEASVDTDAYYENGYYDGYMNGVNFVDRMNDALRDVYWIRVGWTLSDGTSDAINFVDSNHGAVLISPPDYSSNLSLEDFYNSTFYGSGNLNVSEMLEYYNPDVDGDSLYYTNFQVTFYFSDFMNSTLFDVALIGTAKNTLAMLFDFYDNDLSGTASWSETGNENCTMREIPFEDSKEFIALGFVCESPGSQILGDYGPNQTTDFGFVFSFEGDYDDGYANGLVDGIQINDASAYNTGYDNGIQEGYQNGYSAGKKDGLTISENGTWTELFTSVAEAPVNTFQSLFNFEILGLDMRAAFGSILALCVVLIIVKKVVL